MLLFTVLVYIFTARPDHALDPSGAYPFDSDERTFYALELYFCNQSCNLHREEYSSPLTETCT